MTKEKSVSDPAPDGWAVNSRGYIQGGFDTPIFLQAKQRFNKERTDRMYKEKRGEKSVTGGTTDPSFVPIFIPSTSELITMTGHRPIIKEQNA